MAAQSPVGQRPLRDSPLSMAIALAALLAAACDPVAQTKSQPPERREEPAAAPNPASVALIDAERVDASFAAIAAGVEDLPAASIPGGAAQVAALRRAAERAYRNEAAGLRNALLEDVAVRVVAAHGISSLTKLAQVRAAAAARPWTRERSTALDRSLAASPNREAIIALSAAMATPHFAEERALTVRRLTRALDHARRNGPEASSQDVFERVQDIINTTRMPEDAKRRASAGAKRRDPSLIEALLALPAADIASLTRWYSSGAGKAAKDQVVGNFQVANERAGHWVLTDILTHAGAGG